MGREPHVIATPSPDAARRVALAVTCGGVDVPLLDYNMPVMDGRAFAEAYRRLPAPHAPIVCVTAAHDAPARSRELGANAFLGKPFELDDLLARVGQHAA